MSKSIEEILSPKPQFRPKIYAYSINDKAHEGLLKVGQTARDVKQRVSEQLRTAAIKNYQIELDNWRGSRFTDFLNMLKVDGRWQVMNKVFYLHP